MKPEQPFSLRAAALCEQFDVSFTCAVYDGDVCLCDSVFGYADRQAVRKLTPEDTFCLSLCSQWLLSLAALRLVEQKKLRLTQKLSAFYPDYPHADRMTLLMLLRERTGIADYFLSVVRRGFDADPAYRALPEHERILRERQDKRNFLSAEEALALVSALPLDFKPDAGVAEKNRTNAALLAGILTRVTGQPLFTVIKTLVFDPAGMTVQDGDRATTACMGVCQDGTAFPLPRPEGFALPYTYTTDAASCVRLTRLLADGGLLSAASWKLVHRYAATEGALCFYDLDGTLSINDADVLGDSLCLFFSQQQRHAVCYLMSEMQPRRRVDGRTLYFRPTLRYEWEGALQKLTAPRFVKPDKHNIWSALDLRVTPRQEDYVMLAPDAIAYCLVYKTATPYLLMDGMRVIGLLVLEIDRKKDEYEIGIVLIDRRYQGKGYGRFMLTYAVDTLRKAGAKRLSIGVNRENEVARHLYESLGFVASQVYEGGVELIKEDV